MCRAPSQQAEVDPEKLMSEYSEKDLKQLDKMYMELKSRYRQEESSREVRVAVWKSAPYSLVPLFSASILAGFLTLPSGDWWIILLPVSVTSTIGLISYWCWKGAKKFDNKIAETEVRLQLVGNEIQDREAILRGNLGVLLSEVGNISVNNYDFINFNSYAFQHPERFKDARDYFNGPSLNDLYHRYPSLMTPIEGLKKQKEDYVRFGGVIYGSDQKQDPGCISEKRFGYIKAR